MPIRLTPTATCAGDTGINRNSKEVVMKVGDKVIANGGGLGWPYRAEIEAVIGDQALILPLEVPYTASSVRTGAYTKRRRWVRLDRLQHAVMEG